MKLQAPTRLFGYDQPGQRICRLCFGQPIQQRQVARPVMWRPSTNSCRHSDLVWSGGNGVQMEISTGCWLW